MKAQIEIENFIHTPINPHYAKPTKIALDDLKKNKSAYLLKAHGKLAIDPRYFKMGVRAATERVFLRASVYNVFEKAMKILPATYGYLVFDAYRSKASQAGLFESYFNQIKANNPKMSEKELHQETRKYVAHPDEPSRFEVPPHNSGGAIDLSLTLNGRPLNMGSDFDDLTEKAATDYFERSFDPASGLTKEEWESIRGHRRILFHSMTSAGFTNWKHEWWHYDLGNCVWAQELEIPWIFDSMDAEVARYD